LKKAEAAVYAPCKLQEDRRMFTKTVNEDEHDLSVDFAEEGNADSELYKWEHDLNQLLYNVKTGAQQATAQWTEAKNACDKAKADVETARNALYAAQAAWREQRKKCSTGHESRQVALCLFGVHLQRKCGKVAAFHQLMYEVDRQNGGQHSHPDRVEEWRGVAVTKCMMSKVIHGYSIDSAALDACERAVDFNRDVGILERRESKVRELTSPPKFTCSEDYITFSGEIWNVPAGNAPASSDYTKEAFHPAVELKDLGSAPFDFCN